MINKKHTKTPYEIWTGKQPAVSYFKIFGCICFIHNNGKNHLTAFDAKSDEGIFIGYSSVSKAYRVFNKRTLNVEESIHSIFDETNILNKPTDPVELVKQFTDMNLEDMSDEDEISFKRTLQTPKPNVCDQTAEVVDDLEDQPTNVPVEATDHPV